MRLHRDAIMDCLFFMLNFASIGVWDLLDQCIRHQIQRLHNLELVNISIDERDFIVESLKQMLQHSAERNEGGLAGVVQRTGIYLDRGKIEMYSRMKSGKGDIGTLGQLPPDILKMIAHLVIM